ncbi:hypothetical protein [Clostridium beijerinckii]|uniref:hypothetical protein n=1 Tax=Clostridium beijerinckii TaxID=1520 RepID=UPI0004796651|nr:hypothetical protein [Clostridium beijerinckii]
MKDFKQIVKKNKRKALSIAVAATFFVSGPLGFTGCYNPQKEDDEDQDGNGSSYSGGGHVGGWNSFGSGSSINSDSSGKSNASISDSSIGKSSGYSGSKGGSSSS